MKQIRYRIIRDWAKRNVLHIIVPALAASLVASLVLLYVGYSYYPRFVSENNLERVRSGVVQEFEYIRAKGEMYAASPDLAAAVAAEDTAALSRLIVSRTDERGAQLVVTTNKQGNVINRAKNTNSIGDNFFLNNPLGRKVAHSGADAASVEVRSIDPRLAIFSSGHYIYQNDEKVGALFIGYETDDVYARHIAQSYLPENTQIAFYTKDNGLHGTSITRPIGKEVLARYLRPELDIVKTDLETRLVRMPDYRLFIVQNVWLPGAEESTTGLLIFTPLPYIYLIMLLSFIVPLIFFLLLLTLCHREFLHPKKLHLFSTPAIVISVVVYLISVITLLLSFYNTFLPFQATQYPLYNSTLRFQPEGGVFDRRLPQRISVLLDSGGESINAIRLSLEYNPSELKIQSVDMDRSLCEHFILSEHNSQTGRIEMECIISNPGFKGTSAVVTDLFFKAEDHTSLSALRFLEDSQVLANDGLGTNVLRMAINSTIRFEDGQALANEDRLIVFSPTHPNPERWYSKKTVFISWAPSIIGNVSFDEEQMNTNPFGLPPLRIVVPKEGEHNLSVRARNTSGKEIAGAIKVRVDSTPPEVLTLSASETKIKPGGLVRFTAAGSDSLSGLQRVFYLKINNEIFFPIGSEIQIPFPEVGNYTITLRAYDKAGNYRDVSKKITVRRYQ